MSGTKSEIKPTSIITNLAIVGGSIVVDFNNFAFDVRLCISDLEDNISTIDVKDEKGEWYPKRSGTQSQILAELAKYLPDGLTVDVFMADVRELALLLAGDDEQCTTTESES